MKTKRFRCAGFCFAALLPVTGFGQIQTYNLVTGFSDQTNPSGVWSYGITRTGDAGITLKTNSNPGTNGTPGRWSQGCFTYRGGTVCAPAVSYNDGTMVLNWGDLGQPLVRLSKWADITDLPALRFTAPNAGNYSICITAWASRTTDNLVIRTNGLAILSSGFSAGGILHYTNNLSLAPGGVVDVVGSSYNDEMGYQENGVYLSGSVTLDSGSGLPAITFIPSGGLFTNLTVVTLQNNLGSGVIRYTTNGIDPTASATIYSGPVTITAAREFRAAVYDGSTQISGVLSTSYARVYALDDGIPASWRELHFGPDYATDPRVAAEADPDGDLVDNLHEYWAQTDPLNAASVRVVYWLGRDFSTAQNPAGAWGYGSFNGLYDSAASVFSRYPTNCHGAWGQWIYSALYMDWVLASCDSISRHSDPDQLVVVAPPNIAGTCELPAVRFTAPVSGNYRVEIPSYHPLRGPYPGYPCTFVLGVRRGIQFSQELTDAGSTLAAVADVYLANGDTVDFLMEGWGGGGPMGSSYLLRGSIERLDTSGPIPVVYATPEPGLFTNSVSVALTQNTGTGLIRFTLDDSAPTATSAVYSNAIILTAAAQIRAGVFDGGTLISAIHDLAYRRVYAFADDGVPFGWRETHFGTDYLTNPDAAAGADPDGDGSTNREEYLAGTNPLDRLSGFKAGVLAVPKITFPSAVGQTYRILRMASPTNPPVLLATLTATGDLTTYVDESPGSGSFYLIEWVPAP